MKFYIILLLFLIHSTTSKVKSKKKLNSDTPSIIAIQIVDPNENSTSSKNSKRTIESSLGYGYQNNFIGTSKPRYEVYKYSQHDIPAYKEDNVKPVVENSKVQIQKSVQYRLPTITEYQKETSRGQIQPGTTLFSTINAKGQIGDLSSSLPQPSITYNDQPVPVIILRIYPQQLKDSSLFANLPQSHPFASSINNVDLQALLVQYLKQLQKQINRGNVFPQHQSAYYTTENQPRPKTKYQIAQNYQQQYEQPTYYEQPSQYYTPVRQQNNYQQYSEQNDQHQYVQQQYEEPSYDQQYYNQPEQYQPNVQQQYYHQQQSSQSYRGGDESQYSEYPEQQYVTQPNYYEKQYEDASQAAKSDELLTHENYPSNKHTKVVFRTKEGQLKNHKTEEPPTKEIKTINIHVPDNIADVQIEESEKSYVPNGQVANSDQYEQPEQPVYYSQNYHPRQYYAQEEVRQEVSQDNTIKSYKRRGIGKPQLVENNNYYYYQRDQEEQGLESNTPLPSVEDDSSTISSYSSRRKLKKKRVAT